MRAQSSASGRPYSVTAIGVVGPSWAWRQGVRALVERWHPGLPVALCEALGPPATTLPTAPGQMMLLDGAMGRTAVLGWIRSWRRSGPLPRVLVLDVADDVDTILSYIAGGAAGYTTLGAGEAAIIAAFDDLEHGVARCSPEVAARLFAASASTVPVPAPTPLLTSRETEVLRHLARDRSNQEIADLLTVELCTVKHHVHNILRKLNVRHRWQAADLARDEGWLDDLPVAGT